MGGDGIFWVIVGGGRFCWVAMSVMDVFVVMVGGGWIFLGEGRWWWIYSG